MDDEEIVRRVREKLEKDIDSNIFSSMGWKPYSHQNQPISKCTLTTSGSVFNECRGWVNDFIEENSDVLHLPPRWILEKFLKWLVDSNKCNL